MPRFSSLIRSCFVAVLLAAAGLPAAPPVGASTPLSTAGSLPRTSSDSLPVASRVVVYKSERKLVLLRGREILRSYRVALGLNPVGHKERAGDFRTPEGRYHLVKRNPRSDFFLSMQVSYPSPVDSKRARRNGWDPGGSIMIHGLPNEPRKNADYYATQDWTDGCIAVSNSDMVEIWMLVSDNVPIDILP
jgi:murein L,D-transpeptidase YafK